MLHATARHAPPHPNAGARRGVRAHLLRDERPSVGAPAVERRYALPHLVQRPWLAVRCGDREEQHGDAEGVAEHSVQLQHRETTPVALCNPPWTHPRSLLLLLLLPLGWGVRVARSRVAAAVNVGSRLPSLQQHRVVRRVVRVVIVIVVVGAWQLNDLGFPKVARLQGSDRRSMVSGLARPGFALSHGFTCPKRPLCTTHSHASQSFASKASGGFSDAHALPSSSNRRSVRRAMRPWK